MTFVSSYFLKQKLVMSISSDHNVCIGSGLKINTFIPEPDTEPAILQTLADVSGLNEDKVEEIRNSVYDQHNYSAYHGFGKTMPSDRLLKYIENIPLLITTLEAQSKHIKELEKRVTRLEGHLELMPPCDILPKGGSKYQKAKDEFVSHIK